MVPLQTGWTSWVARRSAHYEEAAAGRLRSRRHPHAHLAAIRLGQALSRGGFNVFDHAVICSRVSRDGTVYIVEALPSGAKETLWHYDDHDHIWSTGVVKTSAKAGKAAMTYVDRPYSWLDYAAIAARAWHLWVPGLRHYTASTKHLTSGQLVERAELDAGIQLFGDRRWPGYVR